MKSKEEVIKEAYGNEWENIKKVVDEDGYIPYWHYSQYEIKECDLKIMHGYSYYRPKSLQGIENNNGWIKIESEKDLPEDKKMFHFVPCNLFDRDFIGWIDKELDEVFFIDFEYYNVKSPNSWLPSQITHYQPITKPQPPIY